MGALAGFGFHVDGAVVGFHNAFDDGKAQAGAVDVPGVLVFDPVEPVKDMLEFVFGNA